MTVPLPETPVPVPEAEVTAPGTGVTVGPGGATVDVDPGKAIGDLTGGNQQPTEPAPDGTSGSTAPQSNAGSGSPPRGGAAGPGGSAPSRGGSGNDSGPGGSAGRQSKSADGAGGTGALSPDTQGAVPTAGQARNAASQEASKPEPGPVAQAFGKWTKLLAVLLAPLLGAGAVLLVWSRRRGGVQQMERADVDALTGIPNLLAFEERLADEWRRARRYGRPLGVVLLDLEGLQRVNDRRGPDAGDRLICAVADQIHDHVRASDLGARLTGDMFAVLCPETRHDGLKRLGDKLRQQLETAGIGVSVGWAQLADRDAAPADFLARAHAAMYQERQDPGKPPTARPDLAIAG